MKGGHLPLLILMSLVNAQEPPESLIDLIATRETVVEITDISGNKIHRTFIDSTDTHIALTVERTGQVLSIPRSGVKSVEEVKATVDGQCSWEKHLLLKD